MNKRRAVNRKNPRYFDGTKATSHHLQELLGQVLSLAQRSAAQKSELVMTSWSTVIGPSFEGMAKATSFEEGILIVKVSNSILYSLLTQYERARLLTKLKEQCPNCEIKSIVFRVG